MRGKAVKFETVRGGIPKLSIEFEKGTAGRVAQFDGLELEISEARESVTEMLEAERDTILKDILDALQSIQERVNFIIGGEDVKE